MVGILARLILMFAPVWALVGAAAFGCATIYLVFERCSGSCTGFLEGMNRTPGISPSGLVILVVVIALAFIGRRGRGFAAGFFAAFIGMGAATSGEAGFLWTMPSPRTAWARVTGSSGNGKLDNGKLEKMRELQTRPMDERAGGQLIYWVLDCIADRRPAAPADIATGICQDLGASMEGYKGPKRLTNDDPGWRWSYTKTAQGFQIDVYPDAMLNQTTPQFTADHTGRVTVRRTGAPPADYPRPSL